MNEPLNSSTTAGRPVKRKERELPVEAAYEIIKATDHAVLASADKAGVPYASPITPVFYDGALYFHSSLAGGRRADNLKMNPRCSISFIGKAFTVGEFFSVDFASATVDGLAEEITDEDLKREILWKIIERHAPQNSRERNEIQMDVRSAPVAIWKVKILGVTGKARAAKLWHGPESLKEVQHLEPQAWLKDAPL